MDEIRIQPPAWIEDTVEWTRLYASVDDRMRLAIAISRQNVEQQTGGPFGAAVFEHDSGRLVSVGMNLVTSARNSVLHAEVVAIIMAEARVGSYTLGGDVSHQLVTSCDPCAMCLGAVLWSGVTSLVTGASREDAKELGFDEGPVFAASYTYLEERGLGVTRGVLRADAREVLRRYQAGGGEIYNP